ncbi:hypothetical protein NHX12_004083 [Muraenolepis orangiensis]|uniref:E3 ubiquitin-protein ligase RNF182 n=1 Tax=Muraenolepis orangiensis TaxID=630683 RepID=A0A9Q0IF78_9TELE|nr:hypothetical protein NHX12_004083 [Muraenolepis orangiensis]
MVQLQLMEEDGGGGGDLVEEEEEDLECKICYSPYSLSRRRPKLLLCRHRLCCRCLAKLLAPGETGPARAVVCPFCRYLTPLPPTALPLPASMPDDRGLLAALDGSRRVRRSRRRDLRDGSTELLLTPATLGSLLGSTSSAFSSSFPPPALRSYTSVRRSHNFVVITVTEPPPPPPPPPPYDLRPYRGLTSGAPGPPLQAALMYQSSSSLDSVAWPPRRCSVLGGAGLLWRGRSRALLGLLYFCSLPLGVYLLIRQRTTLGGLLVSLVPASITVVLLYGFCQCLCQELWDCVPP